MQNSNDAPSLMCGSWLVFALLLTGCSHKYIVQHDGTTHKGKVWNEQKETWDSVTKFWPPIETNIIYVDPNGVPHDPKDYKSAAWDRSQFHEHIESVFAAMKQYHESPEARGKKKILIFVHGGMNSAETDLQSPDQEVDQIKAAGYFPIFLCWHSGLEGSYGEHLFKVTQGMKSPKPSAGRLLISPLYLIADIGRAVTRAPLVWANQINTDTSAYRADLAAYNYIQKQRKKATTRIATSNPAAMNDEDGSAWMHHAANEYVSKVFLRLNKLYNDDYRTVGANGPFHEMQVSIGDEHPTKRQLIKLGAMYVITIPTKYGLSWIIDGLGQPAWENMSRRTQTLFEGRFGGDAEVGPADAETADQKVIRPKHDCNFDHTGAMECFARHFAEQVMKKDGTTDYEITLIGHSMGTMVLNEFIRRNDDVYYKNIVYMAAACSVRGFSNAVIPYLMKHRDPAGQYTHFYNLTLHPTADLRERHRGGDIPPRGSLLVWIDDFLAAPQTPYDRVLGRWQSLPLVDRVVPQEARAQISFKAFELNHDDDDYATKNRKEKPQTHGGFRAKSYWAETFWKADPPRDPGKKFIEEVKDAIAEQQVQESPSPAQKTNRD